MRQIDLPAEAVGQGTLDVKAAQGLAAGVSGSAVAARATTGKLYQITVRFRDGSTTVLNEASPRAWGLGNRVMVIGPSNAKHN